MTTMVVIGGGISGLSCALGLRDGFPGAEVLCLESGPRAGGAIWSNREQGFTWESGPNGFLNRHPSTMSLAIRLGLSDEIITACEQLRRRFVLAGGRLRRFPDSPATFLASDLLGVGARLRMMFEPLVPSGPRDREETVGEFARRRLGRGAADLIVEPVVSGIYAGDPECLSVAAALPQLAQLDGKGKSLLRAYLKARREPPGDDGPGVSPTAIGRRRLVSFRGGAGRLVEAMAESLGPSLLLRASVIAVRRDGPGFRVEVGGRVGREISADVVVSAAPAPAAARYLSPVDEEVASAARGIRHAAVAMVALGFREAEVPHSLDGFGHLVAGREGGSVLGVYWCDSVFPGHRCPPGTVLLQVILGGARDPRVCERSDDELLDVACEHVGRTLGVQAAPVLARVRRHPVGIPQYGIGHAARVEAADRASERSPGLFVTGNAWRGVGTNACTEDAERTTSAVARLLGAGRRSPAGFRAPAAT